MVDLSEDEEGDEDVSIDPSEERDIVLLSSKETTLSITPIEDY